jgi:hypothetical protein
MRTMLCAVVFGLFCTQSFGADGITVELPKDHPIVSRLTTEDVKRQTCGQPLRAQVIVQRFAASPGVLLASPDVLSVSPSKTELIDLQAEEINARIEQVSVALASYPKRRQVEPLSAATRERILAAADRKLKQQLDRNGAVLLVGVEKQRLAKGTLDIFDRLGAVSDPSTLGLCKVPPK